MPTGLKIPVRVNKSGGASIETNEVKQTKKLLFQALSEGEDNNPFQDLGLKGNIVFSVMNAAFRGRALQAIENILAKFSERIALKPDQPIRFEEIGAEVEVSFEYLDLLTNKTEEFRRKFAR